MISSFIWLMVFFAAVGHVLTDVGDLGPNNHADLVAQIIEVLVVLIMSQADGVGTDLFDQGPCPRRASCG